MMKNAMLETLKRLILIDLAETTMYSKSIFCVCLCVRAFVPVRLFGFFVCYLNGLCIWYLWGNQVTAFNAAE